MTFFLTSGKENCGEAQERRQPNAANTACCAIVAIRFSIVFDLVVLFHLTAIVVTNPLSIVDSILVKPVAESLSSTHSLDNLSFL